MTSLSDTRTRLLRMEAARRETRRHLDHVQRQIEGRAERMTITEKAKAQNRTHKRFGPRWTRSDEALYRSHVDRLFFERHSEIDALSRKLARQDRALAALRERPGARTSP